MRFWSIALAVVTYVTVVFVRNPGINTNPQSHVVDMVYGRAVRPYQYRVLVPWMVRTALGAVPETVKRALAGAASPSLFYPMRWETSFAAGYGIVFALLLLSLLGFVSAFRYLYGALFEDRRFVRDTAAIAAVLVLPALFSRHGRYVYDFPALFLFTLGLGLIVTRRWGWFVVLFPLACLNKETAILLSLVFAIHYRRSSTLLHPRMYRRLLAYQLTVFVAIRAALMYLFRSNRGRVVEFHLIDYNLLNVVLEPYSVAAVLTAGALMLLLAHGWQRKPVFLRESLVMLVPLVGLSLLFGYIDELRDYYEAYPVVVLLVSSTLCDFLGISVKSREYAPSVEWTAESAHGWGPR
jgi:hypothetical protein